MDIILIIVTVLVGGATAWFIWRRAKKNTSSLQYETVMTMDRLLEIVKSTLADLVKEENFVGLTEAEFNNSFRRKARVQEALKKCVYGIETAKIVVIDLIREVITEHIKTEKEALALIPFNSPYLEPRIKFEVIIYKYKKLFKKDALTKLIERYSLDEERYVIEDKESPSYIIRDNEINHIYSAENFVLEYAEMVHLLAILVYQRYKGFGCVDTIAEMNINGFNLGASGSILFNQSSREVNRNNRFTQSVWIYYRGKYIHFDFLNFGSEEEMRRIIQLICRYNNPGPLTEKRGYIVNTMWDKSRVMAMCPPMCESWAVFVRKFNLPDVSMKALIAKDYVKRADLPIECIRYLMMGQTTTAVTGRQGSGKTTLMTAMIPYCDPRHNIRIAEMAPELYLRELYPERNILSAQSTQSVTLTEIQDAFKKSDAAITLIGEVATDEIAANMIQAAQVASLFTVFSHHANEADDLVYAIRNSLVNAKGYDMATAEQQVLQVIHVNIHLDYNVQGKRFIKRITEIIPLAERDSYPEIVYDDPTGSQLRMFEKFFYNVTDRARFITRDVLVYNQDTDTYETQYCFSAPIIEHIMKSLPPKYARGFREFITTNWAGALAMKEGGAAV
jgi:pilus assembly protein CpaF